MPPNDDVEIERRGLVREQRRARGALLVSCLTVLKTQEEKDEWDSIFLPISQG